MALALQALGLTGPVGWSAYGFIYHQLHPPVCYGWCIDFSGVVFVGVSVIFGLPAIVTALLGWRWRGPQAWPVTLLLAVDGAVGAVTLLILVLYAQGQLSPAPALGLLPVLVALPAFATATMATHLFYPLPWRPLLAVGAAGSLVLGTLVALNVVGPVHQEIPGELPLHLNKKIAYEARDLGCRTYEAGWTVQHTCTVAALVVYSGSGSLLDDEPAIADALSGDQRLVAPLGPLPVDTPVNLTHSSRVDFRNGGFCLLIIDRVAAAPAALKYGHCGTTDDYADIRANWPEDDPYAIGIVYWYTRPD